MAILTLSLWYLLNLTEIINNMVTLDTFEIYNHDTRFLFYFLILGSHQWIFP